jgi:hypothetical protein
VSRKINTGLIIPLVVIAVVGGYVSYFFFLYSGLSDVSGEELKGVRSGTFGDAFGVVNALFSGLAFSGVIVTLLYQRADLAESRSQINRQQIESQFYNLLSLQQSIVQGFDLHNSADSSKLVAQGRDCFRIWRSHLVERYEIFPTLKPNRSEPDRVVWASSKMVEKYQGDAGLYFRSLYSVFRFIDSSTHEDKQRLAVTVRSFLSDYELVALFYNCFSRRGGGFVKYVCKYALFDNLDVELLLKVGHVRHFEKSAFGENKAALRAWEAALL